MLRSSLEFFAKANPSDVACEELARLDPTNPFATNAYLQSERHFRPQTWLLGCRAEERLSYGCLGFVRSGRLNRSLMIPSLPAAGESFWKGLEEFSRTQKISVLELNSFGSPAASIPTLGEEVERIERHEFVLRLDDQRTGLLERMQISHRQRARKGMKAGLRVRITSDPAHLDEHVRLIDSSMQRREAKGENIPVGASSEELRPYLESGFCRIFQAILGEETVSSMMVARASTGAYLYTSGTSPTGMKIGASHFLVHEIAQTCQSEGAHVFNLGGVRDINSGLGQYKRYFGAEMVKLEAAEFYVGSIWQRAISGGAERMHGIVQKALRSVR